MMLRLRTFRSRVLMSALLGTVLSLGIVEPTGAAPPTCFGRPATIVGGNGSNNLVGTPSSDVIVTRGGHDLVHARGGADFVCAGPGFDAVFGGSGHDRIKGGSAFDIFFPGPGDDRVNGGTGGNILTYEGTSAPVLANVRTGVVVGQGHDRMWRVASVGGGESGDVLVGTRGPNDLFGNGGDDVLIGRAGSDFLGAGAGDDVVKGAKGQDIFDITIAHGGPGLGDDTLATSGSMVHMPSGEASGGNDVGDDVFSGIENVGATLGPDSVVGTAKRNFIAAWGGSDDIQARAGDDVVFPGPGSDDVDGGEGSDEVDYFLSHPFNAGFLGPVTIDLGAGSATGLGNDDLSSFEGAIGTFLNDTLIGSNGPEYLLLGDGGSDDISGEGGDDYLDGDAFFFGFPQNLPGNDSLDGGPDQDVCFGGETNQNCEDVGPSSAEPASRAMAGEIHAARESFSRAYQVGAPVRR
jgi:hypothetical protein